jgi:hypothetical protein
MDIYHLSYNVDVSGCVKCIEENNCVDFSNRNQFINKCIPFENIIQSKINILNHDQTSYLYYDDTNTETHYLDKDFKLKKKNSRNIPQNINLNIDWFAKYMNFYIKVNSDYYIPIYYMFINKNNSIFNLFTSQIKIMTNDKNLTNSDKNLIKSIMIIDNDYKFITMSYKFNIFNLSLLCGKFFYIIELLLTKSSSEFDIQDDIDSDIDSDIDPDIYYQTKNYQENFNDEKENLDMDLKNSKENNTLKCVILKLKKIFEGYDLFNLYTIINNYKFLINNFSKKNDPNFHNFMNEYKPRENLSGENILNKNDFDAIVKVENNNVGVDVIKKTNEIYRDLGKSIILLRKIFFWINKYIHDYDKIFIMSILSYRINEKLIKNTWPINLKSIRDFIICNKKLIPDEILKRKNLKSIYSFDKPILYEFSNVYYKNETYGNCMENTILQFFKILFFDQEKDNYSIKYIESIIKSNFLEFFLFIFKNIQNEKKYDFDLKWVTFITELPINNNFVYGDYDFIRVEQRVELNPKLNNLIITLKYLIVDSIDKSTDDIIFLNNIISIIDKTYSIKIIKNIESDIIFIESYKKYILNLLHNKHAYFENSKRFSQYGTYYTNILQDLNRSDKDLKNFIKDNIIITYSDLISYIAIDFIYNNNELYKNFLDLYSVNILSSSYKLLIMDNVIGYIKLNDLFENIILFNYWDNDLWIDVIDKLYDDNRQYNIFWINIAKNKIYKNWNLKIWKHACFYLNKYTNFYRELIDISSCCIWDNEIWTQVFVYGNDPKMIYDAYKLGFYSRWNIDIWKIIFEIIFEDKSILINSKNYGELFLTDIFQDNIYKSWNNNILIEILVNEYIDKNIFFCKLVTDYKIYLNWDTEIWKCCFENLSNICFWEKIDINKIKLSNIDTKLLEKIIKNKNSKIKKFCISKSNYGESDSDSDSDNENINEDNIYYKKYIKYKFKYINLKKNIKYPFKKI